MNFFISQRRWFIALSFALSFTLSIVTPSLAQARNTTALKQHIAAIANDTQGETAVAFRDIESHDSFGFHDNSRQILHSVFKFPIALAVLHKIDQGKFKLDQEIHLTKNDLPENYSPLRDKYPDGNIDITIAQLLGYMISLSDNDACDIILNKLVSLQETEDYMRHLGITDISIRASERDMQRDPAGQYKNLGTSKALIQLLDMAWSDKILSTESHAFLWKIMTETTTGPKRIKGLLPADTVVAHKTGSSSTSPTGGATATNDIGIITLPNGHHLAVAVLLTNSKADLATRESVIARISKAAFDFYSAP